MSNRLALAAAAALVLGVFFAPRQPSSQRVDADRLLVNVLRGYPGSQNARQMILRNYTPLVEGEEHIAGRDAWLVRLKPVLKFRPWRQIWVDKNTLSILAIRDWTHDNRIRRSVKLDRAPTLRPPAAKSPLRIAPVAQDLRLPRYVPRGFELTGVCPSPDAPSEKCAVYSDGLFNISLFYRFSGRQGREQEERLSVVDCGKALAVAVPLATGSVVVVADLPEQEMLRIAGSIH